MKPTTLNVNPELICDIILKIKEFQAKEDVVFPENAANNAYEADWAQILSDHQDDLTYQELITTIEELEPDQQLTLAALVFIGHDDYAINNWDDAIKEAKNLAPQRISDFLLGMPLSPIYLENALYELGIECENT